MLPAYHNRRFTSPFLPFLSAYWHGCCRKGVYGLEALRTSGDGPWCRVHGAESVGSAPHAHLGLLRQLKVGVYQRTVGWNEVLGAATIVSAHQLVHDFTWDVR